MNANSLLAQNPRTVCQEIATTQDLDHVFTNESSIMILQCHSKAFWNQNVYWHTHAGGLSSRFKACILLSVKTSATSSPSWLGISFRILREWSLGSLARLFRTKLHKTYIIDELGCESAVLGWTPKTCFPLDFEDVIHSGWALWKTKWTWKDLARTSTISSRVHHYLPASRTETFVKIVIYNLVNSVEITPYPIFRKWPFWVWKTIHIICELPPVTVPSTGHVFKMYCT